MSADIPVLWRLLAETGLISTAARQSISRTDKVSSKTLSVSNVIAIGAALTGTAGMHVHVGDDARGVQEWHDIR